MCRNTDEYQTRKSARNRDDKVRRHGFGEVNGVTYQDRTSDEKRGEEQKRYDHVEGGMQHTRHPRWEIHSGLFS